MCISNVVYQSNVVACAAENVPTQVRNDIFQSSWAKNVDFSAMCLVRIKIMDAIYLLVKCAILANETGFNTFTSAHNVRLKFIALMVFFLQKKHLRNYQNELPKIFYLFGSKQLQIWDIFYDRIFISFLWGVWRLDDLKLAYRCNVFISVLE